MTVQSEQEPKTFAVHQLNVAFMKKLLLLSALVVSITQANAQDVTITNNSRCDVEFNIHAVDLSNPCPGIYHAMNQVLAAGASITYTPTTFPGWPPPGAYAWQAADSYDAYGGSPGCPQIINTGNFGTTVGTTYCSTFSQTGSFLIMTNCNTCPVGTTVNATWSDNGPLGLGTPTLDFN